ncbi:MAG: LysM peptidoglycan-binding domain-containing protein [Nitrospirae bacterium]|nr:LysM peptidoglycan-binding domain-containing protein [Nitrospirota bacterium]
MRLNPFESKISFFLLMLLVFLCIPALKGYAEGVGESPGSGLQETLGTYYTVKEGDTLWGISTAHYTEPFLWPKLWGKNPSIPHPDRIYPGQKIFLPSESFLKEVEKKEETEIAALTEQKMPEEEAEPAAVAEETKNGEAPKEEPRAVQPEPVAAAEEEETKTPVWTVRDLATGGFISKKFLKEEKVASITASEQDHSLLGDGDAVYVFPEKNHSLQVGEQYTIFEPIKSVYHPETHHLIGNLIRIKGYLEIIPDVMARKGQKGHLARIIKSFDLINVGDSLTVYHPVDPISLVMNEVPYPEKLKGLVIASHDIKTSNQQYDIIYLDKGTKDGIQPGHHLVVLKEWKKNKVYGSVAEEKPSKRITAEIEVISVQEETSTAIINKSLEPVEVGDMVANPPASQ